MSRRANPGPFACGVCGIRKRSNADAFACEQAHHCEDPASLPAAPYVSRAEIERRLSRVVERKAA